MSMLCQCFLNFADSSLKSEFVLAHITFGYISRFMQEMIQLRPLYNNCFSKKTHKRDSIITCLWGRVMKCPLWVHSSLRPRQNGRHFADDIFKCIFLNENVWIPIKISLKSVPKGPINNILALVQIMAWHRPGNKPLSEPMMVSLRTHICVARPQWDSLFIIPHLSLSH